MSRFLLLLLLLLFTLPAVAGTRIVTSVYPLAMIASAVAKPDTEVKHLVPTAAAYAYWQPAPDDLKLLASADVIVWTGPESEPRLAEVLARPSPSQRVITLSKLPGVVVRERRLATPDSRTYGRDPNLWLSTRNAAILAAALGAYLGNPLAAEHFDAEMKRFRDRQVKRFAPIAKTPLLTAQDAYGYLLDEIGLTNVISAIAEPAQEITAQRMFDLAARVEGEHVACMIGAPGFETTIAPQVYPSGHGNVVVLDPQLAGLNLGRSSYTLSVTYFAETLYNCLVTR